MKKLYHCFVSHDGVKRRWLVSADYCIYCKIELEFIYASLSNELKLETRKTHNNMYTNNIDYFNNDCKFYMQHSNCPNGITEEELMIKGIIE